jgi:uncharacterized SAM-binding protein YcdF (DUF218 family)
MKSVKAPLKIKGLKRRIFRGAVIVLLSAIATIGYLALSIYFYGNNSTSVRADAAIVLGAAAWGKEPSPVFRERINHGINLYKKQQINNIVFTGGKGDGDELAEATVARNYAIRHGVLARDILTETQSRTTYQNLYYAKRVVKDSNLSKFLIVSDPLHMKRSVLMAKNLGLDAYSSPTPTTRYKSLKSKLQFLVRETYFYIHYRVSRLLPSTYDS